MGRGVQRLLLGAAFGAAVLLFVGRAVSAQRGQVRVSYDVEFFTSPVNERGAPCAGAAGFDKVSGTITGFEPAPQHEDNVYEGLLTRTTQYTACNVADDPSKPGEYINCLVTVSGRAEGWFSLDVYADGRGAYLKALLDKPVRVISSAVTGNCDRPEMAEWQRDYGSMSTAGSPDGQPINLTTLPRTGPFPRPFPPLSPTPTPARAAGPSAGDAGTWTLTVTGRRP
jgi:hypothetical protein